MRILVVNDDGIQAPGIRKLAELARQFGEVTVAAPKHQCSGMSHRITVDAGLEIARVDFPVEGVEAYSIDGTPADCVKVAISNIMKEKPDIVFSGINRGYNIGYDILYSGTVGAAMEAADVVFVMGHHNEDFDSLGSAIGVSRMARQMGKPVYIILSDMNEGVDKLISLCKTDKDFENLFITQKEALAMTALNPVLFVVDTHIPHLVASPDLLQSINNVIVIDHHRRSENVIKNALLIYIEPYSSSTSELVTELLMYFNENIKLSRLEATALYSGIVVDTKNFRVNTGVRTFDAVSHLRRCGADPEVVHYLFRTDYETNLAECTAIANSVFYPEGLVVAVCPDNANSIQAISGKIADDLLGIENVRVSIVFFRLKDNVIGVSARSTGEINVQVIMEQFGGGGHQNVARTLVDAAGGDLKR